SANVATLVQASAVSAAYTAIRLLNFIGLPFTKLMFRSVEFARGIQFLIAHRSLDSGRMLRVSPKVLMYVDVRTRRTMGAMLGSYIEPGPPHYCGSQGSRTILHNQSRTVDALRAQYRRR